MQNKRLLPPQKFVHAKNWRLCCFLFAYFWLLCGFLFVSVFVCLKSFCKKKKKKTINRSKIIFVTSITYTAFWSYSFLYLVVFNEILRDLLRSRPSVLSQYIRGSLHCQISSTLHLLLHSSLSFIFCHCPSSGSFQLSFFLQKLLFRGKTSRFYWLFFRYIYYQHVSIIL